MHTMAHKYIDITALVNNNGCFDLQFRKDTRHERINAPTYYRWKIQFIITAPKENVKTLEKFKKIVSCGNIHTTKNQARFSVQKVDDVNNIIIPFLKRHSLAEKKKKDFALWQKAADILYRNKGKYIAKWKKNELLSLIAIHKSTIKYKDKPRELKWLDMAQSFAKTV